MSDKAIVMISVGLRPWRKYTSSTFKRYCVQHGFDFHLVLDEQELVGPRLTGTDEMKGRRNKHVYAGKAFLAWKYIKEKGYQRLAVVDDSCSIAPDCPDLFDMVPFGSLGGIRPPDYEAKESFDFIVQHRDQAMLPEFDVKDYVRSGILIYSRDIEPVIAPSEIEKNADLLNSPLPHQTLTYYLCKSQKYSVFAMDKAFLCLPQPDRPHQQRRMMKKVHVKQLYSGYIWAVSGVYRHRYLVVTDISFKLMYRWDKQRNGVFIAQCLYCFNCIRRRLLWLGLWVLEFGRRVRVIRLLYQKLELSINPQKNLI